MLLDLMVYVIVMYQMLQRYDAFCWGWLIISIVLLFFVLLFCCCRVQVVCEGQNACRGSTFSSIQTFKVSGTNSLYGSTIKSDLSNFNDGNKDRTMRIDLYSTNTATPSNSVADITCSNGDTCYIYCHTIAACNHISLKCRGTCYIDCNYTTSSFFSNTTTTTNTNNNISYFINNNHIISPNNCSLYQFTYPTPRPTDIPSPSPTFMPTNLPSFDPSISPTRLPSILPTKLPTKLPTNQPSDDPTHFPTLIPTNFPSLSPSQTPSNAPTVSPTPATEPPTTSPTDNPSGVPTSSSIPIPSEHPTIATIATTPVVYVSFQLHWTVEQCNDEENEDRISEIERIVQYIGIWTSQCFVVLFDYTSGHFQNATISWSRFFCVG